MRAPPLQPGDLSANRWQFLCQVAPDAALDYRLNGPRTVIGLLVQRGGGAPPVLRSETPSRSRGGDLHPPPLLSTTLVCW